MKITFSAPFWDPIDPKKFDFSQISMTKPPILFRGLKYAKKKGFYSIFVIGGTRIRICKCGFLAFLGAKMATIDIQNLKLIVPNDYQQF